MSKHRKTWSSEEKEKIVLYSIEHGVSVASREFGVSSVSIYSWKEKFDQLGKTGLPPGSMSDSERELKQLRRENEALKRIVAEKELAIQIKDSLLKKSQSLKK
ncbi:transposase IS3/IS911 family protein [Leadbetterella byssophila DSM 17132]|uniref:Transposase IS3/IS911 family protein n=1 Tax=Leadbetterella byssophila (strain DSM 17132 / JCM 16389 / KACC 11308 / NBRC 106382 / 4M15) TaxID=649349 RepID=E4RSY0_LEAB4|nr:transposase [Leadbetterella byssophila]ADQ16819.1 transposase IS3/IS911 family protein [Leadbetterella byssophila DSM 17132]ADQ17908.1 transposase IS3/IS911 family protein [Leadbetterella byssophila DSM 17132]MCK9480900.1 transposase [Bacteroidia bacterium]HRP60831.1 transposase [Vicingus sp.]